MHVQGAGPPQFVSPGHNQERLRVLKAEHQDEITLFSAHDPSEWFTLSTESSSM
ncbi:MAG: hypothetical protein ACE366_13785 [Bradymonadia bacterium]